MEDIKLQAILEQMGQKYVEYEVRIADLRVEVTNNIKTINELTYKIDELNSQKSDVTDASDPV